jgi:hypothetical protein
MGKVLPIRFRLADEAGDKVYTATTKNISRGGLCLKVLQEKQELIEKLFQKGHKPAIDIEPPLPNQDAHGSTEESNGPRSPTTRSQPFSWGWSLAKWLTISGKKFMSSF